MGLLGRRLASYHMPPEVIGSNAYILYVRLFTVLHKRSLVMMYNSAQSSPENVSLRVLSL